MGNELSILCDGTDLINTLPDEVLVKIFRYTYDGDCFAPFSYPDIDEEFPRTDKPKEKAIRPLRLVCFRWNRLITGFFTFRRWVRMYIECGKHGLTGEIWTSGKKWTNLEMGEREFPRHVLRYFTKEIVVLLNITNEKDYPLTSNHIKTICEWKIVASKHEIETLFNSLRRPDTLISLQLTGYAMSPHTDAISTFIEAHPNLKCCSVSIDSRQIPHFKKVVRNVIKFNCNPKLEIAECEYEGYFLRHIRKNRALYKTDNDDICIFGNLT